MLMAQPGARWRLRHKYRTCPLIGGNRKWLADGQHDEIDPGCVKTFFRPQKLHATGDDLRRHDGLSIFLLYRVWSQPGRNLGPR